ncbi:hypothetical protein [Pontibacillus halophilus]|uniref:hypothetical protein n=1 Tax=Pontibacillus halophilus TaxID=516704 RepID=UPI00047C32DE|nr:hypothetical protein [Pontibacillus halophilus]
MAFSTIPTGPDTSAQNPFSDDVVNMVNSIPGILTVAFDILTIMFVTSAVILGFAIAFKNPQWTKRARGTMIGTLITVLLLRIAPILMLTEDVMQFKLIVKYLISFIQGIGIHTAIGMFLVAIFIRFFYRMHEVPSHHRWSRSLFIGGGFVTLLSLVMPAVFRFI